MYTINGEAVGDEWKEILVIYNGNRGGVDMVFPQGEWMLVCEDGRMQLDAPRSFTGGPFYVHGTSAIIAYR
jgi:pullulanase